MIAIDFRSAEQYAAHLATYIASPTKIEDLVKLEYDKAPPLHKIAQMRYEVEQAAKCADAVGSVEADVNDDLHWQPHTYIRKAAPRRYVGSRTRYTPAQINLPANDMVPKVVRTHTDLIVAVARSFGLTYSDVLGPSRKPQHVSARAVASKILHERGSTTPRIGEYLNREHSSIWHLIDTFAARCRRFPQVAVVYEKYAPVRVEAA